MYHAEGIPIWILSLDRDYALSEIERIVFYNRLGDPSSLIEDRARGATITLHSSDGLDSELIGTLTSDAIQKFIVTQPTTDSVDVTTPNGMVGDPGVFFMRLQWTPKKRARSYRVQYSGTDGSEGGSMIISNTSTTVRSLTPDTEYEFSLYSFIM